MLPIPSNLILSYSDADHTPVIKTDGTIELPFENEVIAGTGDIILSNGSDTRRIAITDTNQVTFSSSSKFGNYVIINPAQDLVANTHYSIQMASNVIADRDGHVNAAIDNPETLSFNTVDSAPLLFYSNIGSIGSSPFDSDLPVPAELAADDDIWLNFDENVIPDSGSIMLSNGSDTRIIDIQDASQVTFGGGDGSSVVINPAADLIPNTSYHVQIASGVITDTAGNPYAGIHDATALEFTTTDPYFITMTDFV